MKMIHIGREFPSIKAKEVGVINTNRHEEDCLYFQCVEKMDHMAVITDRNHNIIYVNQSFVKETGYSLEEVLGKRANILESGEQSLMFYDNLRHTLLAGMTWKGTFLNKRKDNTHYWEDASIFPIRVNDQTMYIKTSIDVTKRERLTSEQQKDMKLARSIQKSLLPRDVYDENITINGAYYPMENVSGDIFFWKRINSDTYVVFLGDVMGHGVGSALMTTAIVAMVEALIDDDIRPEVVLGELNDKIMNLFKSKDLSQSNYFTAIYLVIDQKKQEIQYANCGHPKFYIVEENVLKVMQEVNFPVGLFRGADFTYGTYQYSGVAKVILYTDGLIENEEGKKNGIELLEQTLTKNLNNTTLGVLMERIEQSMLNGRQHLIKDDVSIIVLEVGGGERA